MNYNGCPMNNDAVSILKISSLYLMLDRADPTLKRFPVRVSAKQCANNKPKF